MGGAIYLNGKFDKIFNTTIEDNNASYYGGGLFYSCTDEDDATLEVAGEWKLTIQNSTFINNTASSYAGGGFYASNIRPVTPDTTFLNNTAPHGPHYASPGLKISFSYS